MHNSANLRKQQKNPKYVAPILYFKRVCALYRSNAIIRVLHNFISRYCMLRSMKYGDYLCKLFQQKLLLYLIPKIHYSNDRDYKCWSGMG